MRNRRLLLVFVIALSFPFVSGCLFGQLNTQQVELTVTGLVSNQGVADVLVTVGAVRPYQSVGNYPCTDLTPEECLDEYAAGPQSFVGTYVASTVVDGSVTFVADSSTFCVGSRGLFDFDPCFGEGGLIDQVTGVDFYVRVEKDGVSEILTVEFTPGNTVSGEFFEITVNSIGEPVLVEDVD